MDDSFQTTDGEAVRILHLPGRTPYARKLDSSSFVMVNGKTSRSGRRVPIDASFDWLNRQDSLDFFDVLHIHSVEFAETELIERVLEKCARRRRRVVFTLHDISPMFYDADSAYLDKLLKVCTAAQAIVTLTRSAARELLQRLPQLEERNHLKVIPHGYVLKPGHARWGKAGSAGGGKVEYAMYGAFRPNRDVYTSVLNWYYALQGDEARLNILCRALNEHDLEDEKLRLGELLSFVNSDRERMRLVMHPFPTDEQVVDFLSDCDVLLMPYKWGTHSGQLELAFDLNLLPVISDVGYYHEQWQMNRPYVPEPVWINWADGNAYVRGARLVESVRLAQEMAATKRPLPQREEYRRHRLREHEEFIKAHLEIYAGGGAI